MRTFVLAGLLLMAMPTMSNAGGPAATRKLAESSLLVSGTVTIGIDGRVLAHTLDPKAPLGAPLTKFIDGVVGTWRFEPVLVDDKVVNAKVPMTLRLVAKRADDGNVAVSIVSSSFGSAGAKLATDSVKSASLKPPMFPSTALRMGGKGTVYLIVQIGRDGQVLNADAEQVNLRVAGTGGQMELLRKQFTDAAKRAAMAWTFTPPTTGEEADDGSWLVRVPVQFSITGEREAQPGEWDTYIPGPRDMGIPWAKEKLRTAGNPDALPEGGVYPLQQGVKLLTPPTT